MQGQIVFTLMVSIAQGVVYAEEQDCLTWVFDGDILHLTCKLSHLSSNVSFVSPAGATVGNCVHNGSGPICVAVQGQITQKLMTNETVLSISKSFRDINGMWECLNENEVTKTSVSLNQGIIEEVQVHLMAELKVINQIYQHRLMCYSCWTPFEENVEFILNTITVDNVRISKNGCYHRRGKCNPDECSCLSSRNVYTWTFRSQSLAYPLNFACGMRFQDIQQEFVKYAYLVFDGTDYIENKPGNTSVIQRFPDKTSNGGTSTDSSKNEVDGHEGRVLYIGIGILGAVLSICIVIVMVVVYQSLKSKDSKKNTTYNDLINAELVPLIDESKESVFVEGIENSNKRICEKELSTTCEVYTSIKSFFKYIRTKTTARNETGNAFEMSKNVIKSTKLSLKNNLFALSSESHSVFVAEPDIESKYCNDVSNTPVPQPSLKSDQDYVSMCKLIISSRKTHFKRLSSQAALQPHGYVNRIKVLYTDKESGNWFELHHVLMIIPLNPSMAIFDEKKLEITVISDDYEMRHHYEVAVATGYFVKYQRIKEPAVAQLKIQIEMITSENDSQIKDSGNIFDL